MKNDLYIVKYKTENVKGTMSTKLQKTFFGSLIHDLEKTITIDNETIIYSEISSNDKTSGYQYYDDVDFKEQNIGIDLNVIKYSNHSILAPTQSSFDLTNNTNWEISIDTYTILYNYIFGRLKENRVFNCLKYTDILQQNINLFIEEYIKNNIMDRYMFDNIELYIKYVELSDGDISKKPHLSLTPEYTKEVYDSSYLIKNLNMTLYNNELSIKYKQIKPSTNYIFQYYFNLLYKLI